MINAEEITVTTSATLLCDATGIGLNDPITVVINPPSDDIWIGGVGVTAADGLLMSSTSSPLVLVLGPHDSLYAIAASTSKTVRVLRTRQNSQP